MVLHKEVIRSLLNLVITWKLRGVVWYTKDFHELVRALVKPTSFHVLGRRQILNPFEPLVNHRDSICNQDGSVIDNLVFYLLQFGLRHDLEDFILHVLVLDDIFEQKTWIDSLMHHLNTIGVIVLLSIAIWRNGCRLNVDLVFLKELLKKELLPTPKVIGVPRLKYFRFWNISIRKRVLTFFDNVAVIAIQSLDLPLLVILGCKYHFINLVN